MVFIRRVVVEYSDGSIDCIDDEYFIKEVDSLMSYVTYEQQHEINNILNMESKNGKL